MAASNMRGLSSVWRQSRLSLKTKLRLYMSLIVPVLLYSCETWMMHDQADLDKLQAFHMRCQRHSWHRWFHRVKNTEVARRTELSHIGNLIEQRRHALFNHVVRMDPLSPAHLSLRVARGISMNRRVPPGWKRPQSRPRSTWVGQIRKHTGSLCPLCGHGRRIVLWRVAATSLQGYAPWVSE